MVKPYKGHRDAYVFRKDEQVAVGPVSLAQLSLHPVSVNGMLETPLRDGNHQLIVRYIRRTNHKPQRVCRERLAVAGNEQPVDEILVAQSL